MPLGLEALHFRIKDTDAVCVALLRVPAQQLLSHADAEHRLFQVANHLVEPAGPEIIHRLASVALSGKQHLVGLLQQFSIVRQHGLNPHPSEGIHHRIDISCVIFDYRYVHEKMIVLFL